MLPRERLRSMRETYRLHIDRIDRDTLDPSILHHARDLEGRIVRGQRTDQVQAGIKTSRNAARGNDPHAAQRHRGTSSDGLAATRVA